MDDVQSLGVIYINHNFATESEATQALNEETDAQGATYYHVILTRNPVVTEICTPVQIFIASTRNNQREHCHSLTCPLHWGFFAKQSRSQTDLIPMKSWLRNVFSYFWP